MSVVIKILAGLAALAVVVLLVGGWLISGSPVPMIPPSRTPPPEGFDAAAFPTLPEITSGEGAEVLNFADYGRPFEAYRLPDLGVTHFTLFTDDDQRRMLFVDAGGTLIGDITGWHAMFPLGRYIVTPDSVYEVSATGVSGPEDMEPVTGIDAAALTAMVSESTHHRSFSGSDLPPGDPAFAAGRVVHVLRHDGVWKRVELEPTGFIDWRGADFHNLEIFPEIGRNRSGPMFDGRYAIELTHFDQQQFLTRRGAPMGSTTGRGRPAQWIGTGYYTVFVDDRPAVRFRVENDSEMLSGNGRSSALIVHGAPGLDFIVIEHVDGSNNTQMILITGQ